MQVLNSVGRKMNLSRADYERLKSRGMNLVIVSDDCEKTDSQIYTATCGYRIKRNDIKCFNGEGIFNKPVMEAKRYKVLPHLFFDNEITIWIDGNIYSKLENKYLINRFLGDADIAIFKHPFRNTVWEEFGVLKEHKRFKIDWLQKKLKEQEAHYKKQGLPANTPLYECNFLIRRNNEKVNNLMNAWWAEITRWQWRDQVSFPYVLWKYGKDIKIKVEEGNIRKNKFFKHIEQNK